MGIIRNTKDAAYTFTPSNEEFLNILAREIPQYTTIYRHAKRFEKLIFDIRIDFVELRQQQVTSLKYISNSNVYLAIANIVTKFMTKVLIIPNAFNMIIANVSVCVMYIITKHYQFTFIGVESNLVLFTEILTD